MLVGLPAKTLKKSGGLAQLATYADFVGSANGTSMDVLLEALAAAREALSDCSGLTAADFTARGSLGSSVSGFSSSRTIY